MSAADLTPDEKAEVARFGIHGDEAFTPEDVTEKPEAVAIEVFMADHRLTRADLCAVLREYRSEAGYSPYEWGERDVLDSQFLSWFEWERLA